MSVFGLSEKGYAMTTMLDESIDKRAHSPLAWLLSRQTFWVFVAAVVAVTALSLATDTFATQTNLFNVTRNFAFVGIVALGMTAVIITGGIDLSVGSVVCLAGIVLGVVMNAGHSIWVGVGAALLTSLAIGALNGVLIAYVRMPPFVVTLGMLAIARSLAMVASNNRMVYDFGPDQAKLLALGGGTTLGVANPVIALAVLALITGYLFRWTQWGRHVFAIGGNEQAARRAGRSRQSHQGGRLHAFGTHRRHHGGARGRLARRRHHQSRSEHGACGHCGRGHRRRQPERRQRYGVRSGYRRRTDRGDPQQSPAAGSRRILAGDVRWQLHRARGHVRQTERLAQ